MNIFSGIFFQPFEGFTTWAIFDMKGGIAAYFGIPLKFKELLLKIFEQSDSEFPIQFIIMKEIQGNIEYFAMSLCHPIHDIFSVKLGIEISTGRLKRLMSKKGYKTYKGKNMIGELPKWVHKIDRR